jgi:hypothetical protein
MVSKPLPPRSSLVLIRHRKRANAGDSARVAPPSLCSAHPSKRLLICYLACWATKRIVPNRSKQFSLEPGEHAFRECVRRCEMARSSPDQRRLQAFPRSEVSSRTTVTKFTAIRRYRFFSRGATECRYARAFHPLLFTKNSALEVAAIGQCAPGDVVELAGRHA